MNFTLILAVVVAVIGALSALPLLVVGLIVAAFSWLTTPSQYAVFSDRLIIYYGKPRVRHVLFQRIEQIELLSLPIGSRLRVRLEGGRMLFIQPRDPEEFQSKFQVALDSYHGDHPGELQSQIEVDPEYEFPPVRGRDYATLSSQSASGPQAKRPPPMPSSPVCRFRS
ncbi:MAG: hypothetical protein J4F46_06225 [Dehalococcoidia bacterium]|nr:hypothetical protein [Dehalococcoidia bacterium]